MGLTNIRIPTAKIAVGDGEIEVRGLSLSDLMIVVSDYGPQLAIAFGKLRSATTNTEADLRTLFGSLLIEFPDMISAAMALAADSFDEASISTLRRLPFNQQFEVLEAIFRLTFPNEGDVKKLLESLTKALTEVSGALATLSPSSTGIGAFAAA